ncbi:hypothetical protein ACJMK2_028834 [Sinanodonta woodiana]|uniref:Diacylglycerol O-acyltransferase n=1 Tax=Sinanodonta woodiana TaxID=1069815 RepID=A0ABD3X8C5_SINWO
MERSATHSYGNHRKDTLSVPSVAKIPQRPEGSLRDNTLLVPSTDTSSGHSVGSDKVKPSSNLTTFRHVQHRSSRNKTNLRRCASVDVAELHRDQKKSSKKKSKSKIDKEKLLSKQDEEILSKWLEKEETLFKEIISSKNVDGSLPKRPDSLKLSSVYIFNSKQNKSTVPQNSLNAKPNQKSTVKVTVSAFPSPEYRKSRKEKDEQKSDIKVHKEKPSSQRKTSKKVSTDKQADRMDKVTIDFAKLDEVPSEFSESVEGYRKHGLKHNFPSAPYIKIRPPMRQNIEILGLCIYSIFAFLVFLPMAAVLLVLFPLCFLLKKMSSCCCCCSMNRSCCCCKCGEIVSYSEHYWLQDYQNNPLIVQSILVVECGLDQYQIQNLINARVVVAEDSAGERLYPRFTQKLSHSCCQYMWVEDRNFLIQNHIFTMPRGIESLEDLQDYISEMASKPLSYATPLWEVQILPNFGQHRDTILLFRMHPCMADGISMVKILYKSIADVDSVTTIPPKLAQRSSTDIFKSVFYGPLTFFCKVLCCTNDFNLLHGKYLHQSGKRVLTWSEPVSMSAAIRIKQVTRSTLNEVLVSVASGCIRNYLKFNGIPNPYDMKCIIPVYYGNDLEKPLMANKILLMQVSLPTNTEGTVPRLWQMKKNMDNVRKSSLFSITFDAFRFTNLLLPDSLWHCLWNYFFNCSTCLVSSLPGPEICLRLASKQIKTIFFWFPPVQKVALSISFFTYNDQLQMAISADRSALPNPEVLAKDFIFQVRLSICSILKWLVSC